MKKIEIGSFILISHLFDDSHYNVVIQDIKHYEPGSIFCLVHNLLEDIWFIKYYNDNYKLY